MELEKEIKEIIEKSLPKQVGEVLAARLKAAEEDAIQVKNLRESNVELINQNKVLFDSFRQAEKKLSEAEKVAADYRRRESVLANLETEKKLIEMRAANAEERVKDHKEMMQTVFRVATVRETIYTNTFDNVTENDNGSSYSNKTRTQSGGNTVTKETLKE